MDADRMDRVEELFESAIRLDPSDRDTFLARECPQDPQLVLEVRSLLAADDEAGEFLSVTPLGRGFRLDAIASEQAAADAQLLGVRVGPYRLSEIVGSGGMGTVFLAVRADDQYDKRVAIKLIKLGMESDAVLRRFRAERQALAHLDHPNIARLLDGGMTGEGRPYLVMEYIEGEPIDVFCDARRLSIDERLRLFLHVCDAVQYAHGKLVVHRDIKPGNVLVTSDGVPKLLDFGLAKVLDPRGTGQARTTVAQSFLTPDFASPEQVLGGAITTGTDVYALGATLYELLTGHRLYRLTTGNPLELHRIICEEEPTRPSLAVRKTVELTTSMTPVRRSPDTIARERRVRPDRLGRLLAGDLDTILLKALRKEPERRYASAGMLAEDIRRHLDGRPVLARKPTARYRAAKLLRRRKGVALAVSVVALAVVAGALGIAWEARRARAEADKAGRVLTSLEDLFRNLDPRVSGDASVLDVLNEKGESIVAGLSDVPDGQIVVAQRLADVYDGFGARERGTEWRERISVMSRALYGDQDLRTAEALYRLGSALRSAEPARAASLLRHSLDIRSGDLPLEHPDVLATMEALAWAHRHAGALAESERLISELVEIRRRGPPGRELVRVLVLQSTFYHDWSAYEKSESLIAEALTIARQSAPEMIESVGLRMAGLLHDRGRYGEAEPYYRARLESVRSRFGEDSRPTARAKAELALLLKDKTEYEEAALLSRESVRYYENLHDGAAESSLRNTSFVLAKVLSDKGDLVECERVTRKVLELSRSDWERARPLSLLARTLVEMGRHVEAELVARESVRLHELTLPGSWNTAKTASILGAALVGLGRFDEAEPLLLDSYPAIRDDRGPGHRRTRQALARIVAMYEAWQRPVDAETYRELLARAELEANP